MLPNLLKRNFNKIEILLHLCISYTFAQTYSKHDGDEALMHTLLANTILCWFLTNVNLAFSYMFSLE